jgi:HK97 family phage major capsid protein
MQKISILKTGVTADQYRRAQLNNSLLKDGKKPVILATELSETRKRLIESYRMIARGEEIRAVQTAGFGTVHYSNNSGNSFVPTSFMYSGLQNSAKMHSPLFDSDKVTFGRTDKGNPTQVPLADDTSEVATVVGEAVSDTDYETIQGATQIMNYTFMYRTPKISTTIEFDQDAFLADTQVSILENFFAERIARGVSAHLLNGNGSGKPLGLLPSLDANGVFPISAAGSSENDGIVSNTGANSIGSRDLQNLYHSVDVAYRNSPKAAWIMADTTLLSIEALVDKYGNQLELIKYVNGGPTLFGKPVYSDPNMAAIAPSAATVIFGDLGRWFTRYVPSAGFITRYFEVPGLAENGEMAWTANGRFGGCLLSNASVQTPINYLRQHS